MYPPFTLNNWLKTEKPIEGVYAVMQFTNLKDRNGKEIYEGDIVKNEIGNIEALTHHVFNDWGWHSGYFTWEDIEVIGNIYENPELLKDTNANR